MNGILYFGFTILFLKMGKRKKEEDNFLRKKTEEKQNGATIMIPVDRK